MSNNIKWSFSPYNFQSWNTSQTRVMLVAAEPNGENPGSRNFDMGDWFRTAHSSNKFHKNKLFYNRCKMILNGIFESQSDTVFNHFRFIDLKATAGTSVSQEKEIIKYVENNLENILEFFISNNEAFGLYPHVIILLGNNAYTIFSKTLRDKVALINPNLQWICMPHPSAQTISNDLFLDACAEINFKLELITKSPKKWFCKGKTAYGWKQL